MKRVFEDNGSLKLIFIRHGKPDYNDCGDRDCSDGDLDETGIAQCAALGERYKDIPVDAVFIGPNDLAHAMGHGSDWNAVPVQRAIEEGLRAIAGAGKCSGIVALTPQDEEKYGALGARYFANVSTSIITRALAQAASAGRDTQLRY